MKTQVTIESGKTTILLTPENEFERDIIEKVYDDKTVASVTGKISYNTKGYHMKDGHYIQLTLNDKNDN